MAEGEAEPPTTVHVITETRNLRSPPFIAPRNNRVLRGVQGKNGWRPLNMIMNSGISNSRIQSIKKDALIIYGGKEVAKLDLPNSETGNPYEKLRTKLNNHYLPKKNKHYARYHSSS